mgnify:CR=1 FL=1
MPQAARSANYKIDHLFNKKEKGDKTAIIKETTHDKSRKIADVFELPITVVNNVLY